MEDGTSIWIVRGNYSGTHKIDFASVAQLTRETIT